MDNLKELENLKFAEADLEKAKLECSRTQQQLCHHLEFEKLITSLSAKFINLPVGQIDQGINQALKAIAEFSGVDRSYIFMLQHDLHKLNNIYEWCAEGVDPQIKKMQGLPVEEFSWFIPKIMNFETVYVPCVTDMPDEASAEKRLFLSQSVKSFICLPIVYQDSVAGFIGFDTVHTQKEWPQENISLLQIIGEMFINIIQRKRMEEALRGSGERLVKLNECFIKFNDDSFHNINLLVEFCGRQLGAVCAFYNRLENGLLHSLGQWNAPADFIPIDKPQGHICYDIIQNKAHEVCVIRDLEHSKYAQTDPNVLRYGLKTYVGQPVAFDGATIGSLCVLYQKDYTPTEDEKMIFQLAGSAIAVEENRRQAREFVKDSEQRYRILAESAQDFIFIIGADWRVKYLNRFGAEAIGYTPEEVKDKFLKEIFPQNIAEVFQEELSKIFVSGQTFYGERKIEFTDRVLWLSTKLVPLKDAQGNIISVMGISRDITDKQLASLALQDSKRFLSDIFSSIQDGICIIDAEMNILQVNHTMEVWYAFNMPLVGKKCYEAYHCRNAPCTVCPSRITLETGKADYKVVPRSDAEGKVAGWMDLYSFPLIDSATGKLKGAIEYVRDITERRRAEEEKAALNKEVFKSNKRLKSLALKDPQTGLFNHNYLQEVIESEFYRSRRYAQPLSLMMLDIDYFKSINDVYGHKFGDLVLKQFAKILRKMVRRYDTVIRYGGEEFMIISSGTDRTNALVLAKRILDAINLFDFGNKKHSVKLKLSIAVVSYNEDKAVKAMDLVELADQILNQAKEFGGNRVYSSLDMQKNNHPHKLNGKAKDIKFLNEKIEKLSKRANQSLMEAIFAFAKTIEVKDHYTGEHVEQTVRYATEIAKAMDLSDHDIELIRQAAMLHDLGKIGISEKILLKKGKLDKKEYEEIKKHPQIGVDIIRPIQFLHPIIPILLYHHERWDGKGYPNSLRGEEIPIGARIVAIADVYQALISNRCYRRAYSQSQAIKIIQESSGKLFDPAIVDAFLRIVHKI